MTPTIFMKFSKAVNNFYKRINFITLSTCKKLLNNLIDKALLSVEVKSNNE